MTKRTNPLLLGGLFLAAAALAIYLGLHPGRRNRVGVAEPQTPPPRPQETAERSAAEPPRGGIVISRDGLLAFLGTQAKPTTAAPSGTTYLFPELRADALEALAIVAPQTGTALLQEALAGEGEADPWPADRLHAALLRVRAGQADGAETVKAWLQAYPVPSEGEGVALAAEAASWMGPEAGGAVVRQMLSVPLEDYNEDDLAAILQAAAVLNAGTTVAQLQAILAGGLDAWGFRVLAAAAGALRRLGDDTGQKVLDLAAEDEWFEGDEVAIGLAIRGDAGGLAWLDRLIHCEDAATRAQAARALRVVGDVTALPLLRQALEDEDSGVRAEAAISLAELGDDSGLAQVREALGGTSDGTVIDAWRVLARRGDSASRPAATALLAGPLPAADDLRRGAALRKDVWAAVVLLQSQE